MDDGEGDRAPPPPPTTPPPMTPRGADEPSPREATETQEQPEQLSAAAEQPEQARDEADMTTAVHHQSDAEPTMSSAQPEACAASDAIKTAVDLERVRIKMEVARVRSSGPTHEIPSGRVFDSPPGGGAVTEATDEEAEARADSPSDSIDRLEAHDADSSALRTKESARDAELSENTRQNAEVSRSEDGAPVARAAVSKVVVDAADDSKQQRDKRDGNSDAMDLQDSVAGDAQEAVDAADRSSSEVHGEMAQSKVVVVSDTAKASKAETVGGNEAEPSTDSTVAPHPSSKHETPGGVAPPPEFKLHAAAKETSSSRHAAKHRTVPDENRPLNEYLVSELELFSSVMRGERVVSEASRVNRAAHASTLQLYYEHSRALRDYDADWRRSHVGAKSRMFPRAGGSPVSRSKDAAVNVAENPFKRGGADSSTRRWASVAESIRPLRPKADGEQLKRSGGDGAKLDLMYQRGLNGLVVADSRRDLHRRKLRALMVDVAEKESRPGVHIVVASNSELLAWESELRANDQAEVYPYWGEKADRQELLAVLSTEYFSRQKPVPHVLLTSFDIFAEDVRVLSIVQWQLTLIEVPEAVVYQEQLNSVWMQLLGLRSRHRLLVAHQEFHVDTRRVLQFLLPGLFSSRRKLLAWNCAAFDADLIHRMCDTIAAFAVASDQTNLQTFIAAATQYSIVKSDQELSTLSLLNRSGVLKRTASHKARDDDGRARERKSPKGKNGALTSIKVKARRLSEDLSMQLAHKKRRGSDGTPRSRKRISRCGKCAGCLAGDCMKCGHCQDMKKYGGPGLRKQSCKNRKCISPKRWGMAVRKSKKARLAKQDDGDEEALSEKYDTDLDGEDQDDGATSYYSQDSDRDSSFGASASHEVVNSDSDGHEFLRSSEELPLSPRVASLMSNEKLQDDDFESGHSSGLDGEFGSKSSRTRVMRCGKCIGCTASDCLKCRHCLDMKKYGGPGLRKQSCKNRKCIVPKVVLLNQSKDDEYLDERGNIVYPDYYDGSDVLDGAVLYHTSGGAGARTAMISLVQECEVFIDRHLVFTCDFCVARFSSRGLLELHERVEHLPPGVESHCEALEKEASRMLLHPIQQNCFINAQLREKKKTLRSCPRAYAKLEGSDFHFFVMTPYVVLGRLHSRWRDFYSHLGISSANGLGGGGVDCQVGDNESISEQHALISWDFTAKRFTIECLSVQTAVCVNGRSVRVDDEPLPLQSQNEVRVGSSSFYFLLPKIPSDNEQTQAKPDETLARPELQAWLNAAMRKRRASASGSVEADLEDEVALIKKRCHERLAAVSTSP